MNPQGNIKHGHHGTPTYMRWKSMLQRCHQPRASNFKFYGGQGITVCPAWRESFTAFLRDMGECPSPQHTVDRLDNHKNYEPGNCQWATKAQQNRHKSNVVPLTHAGKTMTVEEWAAELGMAGNTLRSRLRLGWSVDRALTEPLGASGGSRGRQASKRGQDYRRKT